MNGVVFIGSGNMARWLVTGLVRAGVLEPDGITVCDILPEKSQALSEELGVVDIGSEYGKIPGSEAIVLAIKPQDAERAITSLAGNIDGDTIVISVVAGLTRSRIRELLDRGNPVVRVMPNLGASVGAAMSAFAADEGSDAERITREMFSSVGEVVRVKEDLMDLVTAVSGSGPAYFFLMVEALRDTAVKFGMSEDVASILSEQTMLGASLVLKESEQGPEELRRAVSSPGGTTLRALEEMENRGFREIIELAVRAAANRSRELST